MSSVNTLAEAEQQNYGLTKLALLNTAGYAKCVLPLDNSASVCAPNNTGKSSVINALQFPLINDLRMTEWDGHDLEETRKFYFGTDQSYILLEAQLPSGPVVIGVAGLGKIAGYQHQYFCYPGKLDLAHYSDEKKIVRFSRLFKHLDLLGFKPIELKAQELNALLIGAASPFDDQISLKMIPLTNTSDAPVYKEIFRRILNLHKLGANDVKRFMLRVFERHMSNAKVDFYEVWSRAFDKVTHARRELRVLESMEEPILALSSMLENQSVLKGKLAAYVPKLDQALLDFQEFFEHKSTQLQTDLDALSDEKTQLEEKQQLYVQQLREIERKRVQIESWFNQYDQLHQQFELAQESTLKQRLHSLKSDYEVLSHSIASAEGQSLTTIDIRIKDTEKQLKSLNLRLKNLEFNLFTRMREDLTLREAEDLSRILNPDLLALPYGKNADIHITDEAQFSQLLETLAATISGGVMSVNGATIKLKKLPTLKIQTGEDKNQLKAQIDALTHSLEDLKRQYAVADNAVAKLEEKEHLYQALLQAEEDLKQFERYQTMLHSVEAQTALQDQLEHEQEQVQSLLTEVQRAAGSLADRRSIIKSKIDSLIRQSDRLKQVKAERIDHQLDLYAGKSTPYLIDIVIDFDNLSDILHSFNKDCQELRNFDINVRNTYLHIYNGGITKYDSEPDESVRYQKLIAAFHNIDNEHLAVERQAKVALTEVAATIKGLREDLNRLRREMHSFNQGIGQHKISNLQAFKIDVIPRKMLVESIDTLLATSDLYQQGDTLDLLSSTPVDDKEIEKAKDHLINLATEKAGLTLGDLFDIRFEVVNRTGKKEFFDKIDSAGSNGTRITIKLLCGMLFIRHLLSDDEQVHYRIPIYIDEAADIDPQNQQAIIETAMGFGFMPIFASVKPQIACHYIVPIGTVNDGKQNWVDEKDWIRVTQAEPA